MNMIYKKIRSLVMAFVMLIAFSTTGFAGITNDIINKEIQRREHGVEEILKEKDNFSGHKNDSAARILSYNQLIANIEAQHRNKHKQRELNSFIKSVPQVFVCVSLSIPDTSLKKIIQDADYYQIPVVVRGLYKNSFRKTFEKIFDLIKEENKGGIMINPRWFKEYEIKSVPAFVINTEHMDENGLEEDKKKSRKSSNKKDEKKNKQKHKKIDVIYGNIPIRRALTIVAERGENHKLAKIILSRGGK